MESKIFAVYDSKAKAFMAPFVRPTVGMAIRDFANLANDKEHMFCINAEDYILYEVGTWDDNDGSVTEIPHETHGKAIQYLHQVIDQRQLKLETEK